MWADVYIIVKEAIVDTIYHFETIEDHTLACIKYVQVESEQYYYSQFAQLGTRKTSTQLYGCMLSCMVVY